MSSAASAVPLGPTYGAELLATFVSVALWGTTCMQTAIYFIQYPGDRPTLKALVVFLWLADTVHEILLVKGVYGSQIIGFCDFARIGSVVPEFLWQVLFTSLVSISSQIFFTYRIWRFSDKPWFCWALLAPVCLFELAGAIAFIAFGTVIPTAAELVSPAPSSIFTAVQAVAAVADMTIASAMMYLLIRSREHALKESRTVLHKLLILTINTGIWTAMFAVFAFVSILAFKETLIYAALYFPLCPLYCNTVLANLNARDLLKIRTAITDGGTFSSSYNLAPVFQSARVPAFPVSRRDSALAVQVEVNKSVIRDVDEPVLRPRGAKIDVEGP